MLSQIFLFDGSVQPFHSIHLNVACKSVIDHYCIQTYLQISDQVKPQMERNAGQIATTYLSLCSYKNISKPSTYSFSILSFQTRIVTRGMKMNKHFSNTHLYPVRYDSWKGFWSAEFLFVCSFVWFKLKCMRLCF